MERDSATSCASSFELKYIGPSRSTWLIVSQTLRPCSPCQVSRDVSFVTNSLATLGPIMNLFTCLYLSRRIRRDDHGLVCIDVVFALLHIVNVIIRDLQPLLRENVPRSCLSRRSWHLRRHCLATQQECRANVRATGNQSWRSKNSYGFAVVVAVAVGTADDDEDRMWVKMLHLSDFEYSLQGFMPCRAA